MEAGRGVFVGFWRTPPAELALLLSLLLHAGLAFWRLWQRRSLRMPPIEVLQLVNRRHDPALAHRPCARHRCAAPARGLCVTAMPTCSPLPGPADCRTSDHALGPGLAARLHRPASLAPAQALVPTPACPGARPGPAPAGPRPARHRLGRTRLRPTQGRRPALGAKRSPASSAGHRRRCASGWSTLRSGGSSKASSGSSS